MCLCERVNPDNACQLKQLVPMMIKPGAKFIWAVAKTFFWKSDKHSQGIPEVFRTVQLSACMLTVTFVCKQEPPLETKINEFLHFV